MDDLEALFHIFGENAVYIDEKFFEQLEQNLPRTDPETDEGSIDYVT
jgi:hypothetical protein